MPRPSPGRWPVRAIRGLESGNAVADQTHMTLRRPTAAAIASDSGTLVLGWLLRMTMGIGLVGIMAFDGLSVAVTHVRALDDASSAAYAASDSLRRAPKDLRAAFRASESAAVEAGSSLVRDAWYVDRDGSVHVTVQKTAHSWVFKHIPPLVPYLTVTVEESASPLK